MSKIKAIVIILIILVVVCTGGLIVYLSGLGAADKNDKEDVSVTIPNGSGASYIVSILDDAGLVKNSTCAKINDQSARANYNKNYKNNHYCFDL
jgi:cell division protein YceG involved in septum cleavage